MNEKKAREKRTWSDSLGLPRDAVKGETIVTATGRSALRIENYRSILIYSDTKIRIQAKRYKLSVTGKHLRIRYYDKDEMEITGYIETVSFEQGGIS